MGQTIHSCFISYRHPATAGGRESKLIRQVVQAIKDHVEVYTHQHEVYFDEHRLIPGYEYDERLAAAICRSACMVVVYWPSYLESEYCQKELRTMLAIEKQRRDQLDLHGCRLFIPIILRGDLIDLPEDVRKGCQYLNYGQQAIRPDFNLGDDPEMSNQLFAIAGYIKTLCDRMKAVEDVLFRPCSQFTFARENIGADIALPSPALQPFPGR